MHTTEWNSLFPLICDIMLYMFVNLLLAINITLLRVGSVMNA